MCPRREVTLDVIACNVHARRVWRRDGHALVLPDHVAGQVRCILEHARSRRRTLGAAGCVLGDTLMQRWQGTQV